MLLLYSMTKNGKEIQKFFDEITNELLPRSQIMDAVPNLGV